MLGKPQPSRTVSTKTGKTQNPARVIIVDPEGNTIKPVDIVNAMDLLTAAAQARHIIQECERLAREKNKRDPKAGAGTAPYST